MFLADLTTGKMVKCIGVTKAKENDGLEDGRPDKNCYLFCWPTYMCLHRLSCDNHGYVHLFT